MQFKAIFLAVTLSAIGANALPIQEISLDAVSSLINNTNVATLLGNLKPRSDEQVSGLGDVVSKLLENLQDTASAVGANTHVGKASGNSQDLGSVLQSRQDAASKLAHTLEGLISALPNNAIATDLGSGLQSRQEEPEDEDNEEGGNTDVVASISDRVKNVLNTIGIRLPDYRAVRK